jgi:protein-tyrosine phosphatase
LIDLHTHVLPGVDDGPDTMEGAVETVSALASGGTEVIVATPHNMPGAFETALDEIRHSYEALRGALAGSGVPAKLLLGQEITFRPGLLTSLECEELLTINGTSYFLFEFPPYTVAPQTREFIFEARIQGYRPILAHPERNEVLSNNLDLLAEFVDGGALVQLTASSLFGRLGEQAQRSSHLMLQKGLAHFIATDSHSFRFGPGDMKEAERVAAGIIGEEAAGRLVRNNPLSVIEGRPLAS